MDNSSNFIVYGYGKNSRMVLYSANVEITIRQNRKLKGDDLIYAIQEYLEDLGLDYFNYDPDFGTVNIGCILPEGNKSAFMSRMSSAEETFKRVDKEFGFHLANKVQIYCDTIEYFESI